MSAWLNVSAHLDPRFGGIAAVLPSFCRAVSLAGAGQVSLAGFCHPDEVPADPAASERLPLGRLRWLLDRDLRGELAARVQAADGVHIHGLWQEPGAVTAPLARAARRPYVMSAHGMLEKWARGQKRLKKALYGWAIEYRNLRQAKCLHALTRAEANDYREVGLKTPVAIVPNGVEVPPTADPDTFFAHFPGLKRHQIVLFLARLHHKKGLHLLVEAWREVAPRWPDGHLVLAGPDCEGTRAVVERQVAELGLASRVTFTGMLTGERKWGALAAANAFVLPSYSEGLSVSVLEAMAMGRPVIVTRQCNVPEVAAGCGWLIQPDAKELAEALTELSGLSGCDAEAMGAAGRTVVARRYSWPVVGAQMTEVYRWALGGPVPTSAEVWMP